MEGRMMLSGTGFDSSLPGLDLTQYTVAPAQIRIGGAPVTMLTQPVDGGFINADAGTYTNWLGSYSTSIAGSVTLQYALTDQVLARGDFQGTVAKVSLLSGTGIVRAIFLPSADTAALDGAIQPVAIGPSPTLPGISEGGSIPIHAIFADFHRDSHLASGVKPISTSTSVTSVAPMSSAGRISETSDAVSGEWARAMVFEIAGGEPTAIDSHSLSGQHANGSNSETTLQHNEPLSSIEAPQQNETVARRNAASLPSDSDQAPQAATITTQVLGSGKLAAGTLAADALGQFSASNELRTENPDLAAFASAAVFEQLGKGIAAVIDSSASGKSWLASVGTSPLLMILALERISALNSRRAARESRIAASKSQIN